MKRWFLPFIIFCGFAFGAEASQPYSCQGILVCSDCPDGTARVMVMCSISGSYSGPVQCYAIANGDDITCQAKDGSVIIKEQTRSCEQCPNGSGGGNGGGGCDVAMPFWWLFCNPFAI